MHINEFIFIYVSIIRVSKSLDFFKPTEIMTKNTKIEDRGHVGDCEPKKKSKIVQNLELYRINQELLLQEKLVKYHLGVNLGAGDSKEQIMLEYLL